MTQDAQNFLVVDTRWRLETETCLALMTLLSTRREQLRRGWGPRVCAPRGAGGNRVRVRASGRMWADRREGPVAARALKSFRFAREILPMWQLERINVSASRTGRTRRGTESAPPTESLLSGEVND